MLRQFHQENFLFASRVCGYAVVCVDFCCFGAFFVHNILFSAGVPIFVGGESNLFCNGSGCAGLCFFCFAAWSFLIAALRRESRRLYVLSVCAVCMRTYRASCILTRHRRGSRFWFPPLIKLATPG